ncbi:MAG: UDP-N-acetylmuramate dehydrogenase [Phycisphaerae bacterium]|jgi:UDP-N-acetylmuramate dehydrogenase
MAFLSDLSEIVTEYEPLGPLTYFGLGGPARWLVRPRSLVELAEVTRRCRQESVPLRVLGRGANLLVGDDGVDGVVLRLEAPAFKVVNWRADRKGDSEGLTRPDADAAVVTAGAGTDMARLSLDAVRRGLAGLECMAGIPGTLGGIIRMNAGGRFGQIADAVRDVTAVDADGEVRRLSRDEVGFGYRHTELGGAVVCGATLLLRREDEARLRKRHAEIWNYKKASQPLADSSAGCVFKNPPGASAGRLIDQAGLKGYRVGGASVSPQHANFIVAGEGATAGDVLAVIRHVRRTVAERTGVALELEIEVWRKDCPDNAELAA